MKDNIHNKDLPQSIPNFEINELKTTQSQESNQKNRQSNFELLRIISMFLIIFHHFSVHGLMNSSVNYTELNIYLIRFLAIGGKLGVNLFILISGYFLINSKFNFKRLLKLIFQTFFYSLVIYITFIILNLTNFSFKDLVKAMLPITTGSSYWFIGCYVVLYLLFPFINILLKNINKKQHLTLVSILLFFFCIQPSIFKNNQLSTFGGFITLYITSAYIKLYNPKIINNKKLIIPLAVTSFFIMGFIYTFFEINKWQLNSLLCVICSITTFC